MYRSSRERFAAAGPRARELLGARKDRFAECHASDAENAHHHPMGTALMGTNTGFVVDEDLRVRGVQGLRMAGASVSTSQ